MNSSNSHLISILLVDSHALVRRGVRRLLEDDPEIKVIGEAGDSSSAIRIVHQLNPRVVIMDCVLPGGVDGFKAARTIVDSCPLTSVIMLSGHTGRAWLQRAIQAGVQAFIPKNSADLDLVQLVRRVAAGEKLLFPASPVSASRSSGLSARELQILRLVVDGNSTKEIAFHLGLSVNTVSVHRNRIARSLGLRNTAELVTYALQNGLAEVPS